LLSKGVRHVVCWPSEVHDFEAASFGIRLTTLLLERNIAEAFGRAAEGVGHSERAPKLLVQSVAPQAVRRLASLWVVLERRGKTETKTETKIRQHRSCTSILGKEAKVLPHTAVNGWVRVEVGGRAVAWRVGHWRLRGPADTEQEVKIRSVSGLPPAGKQKAVPREASGKPLEVLPPSPPTRPSLKRSLALDSLELLLEKQARPKRQRLDTCKGSKFTGLLLQQQAQPKRLIASTAPVPLVLLLEKPRARRPKLKRSTAHASFSFLLRRHPSRTARPTLRRSRALDCLGALLRQLRPASARKRSSSSPRRHLASEGARC